MSSVWRFVHSDALDGVAFEHVVLLQQLLGESLLREKDVSV